MASSDNLHKQVSEAVQKAVNSSDFSGLQSAIEKTIGAAATGIGNGLATASANVQLRQAQLARLQEQKRYEDAMAQVYKSSSFQRSIGIALVGWGGLAGLFNLVCIFVTLSSAQFPALIFFVPCLAISAVLLSMGVNRLNLVNKFERYRDIIGLRPSCKAEELAANTGDHVQSVVNNLRSMISKGLFKQAALSDDATTLFLTNDAYRAYQQNRNQQLASAAVEQAKAVQQKQANQTKTAGLSPKAQALLSRGETYIGQIRQSNKAIKDPEITATIDKIEHVVRTIFQRAAERPEVIDDLDQMMNYFLPTTVKLLDAYRDLDAQPLQSETITKSKREIEGALDALSSAYEKLLDSIFKEFTMDVSSDISVLHTVLAQEGLVDGPFDKASKE